MDEATSNPAKQRVAEPSDYAHLPEPVDLSRTVTTCSTEPDPFEPDPIWTVPEIAGTARTNSIG